jgi:hypothetical protein
VNAEERRKRLEPLMRGGDAELWKVILTATALPTLGIRALESRLLALREIAVGVGGYSRIKDFLCR